MLTPIPRSYPTTESIHIDFVHYEANALQSMAFCPVRAALDRLEACLTDAEDNTLEEVITPPPCWAASSFPSACPSSAGEPTSTARGSRGSPLPVCACTTGSTP